MNLRLRALVVLGWASIAASLTQGLGTWKSLAPITIAPRQEHATVALSSSKLAIIGGIIPHGEWFNTTALVQLYDIPSNKWSSAASAPLELNHPNAAVVNGNIYLLGGLAETPEGAWEAVPDSWVYEPATETWTRLPSMPQGTARGSATLAVHGHLIILAGGMRKLVPVPGGEQDTVDLVSIFDTKSNSWIAAPKAAARLPAPRDHSAGAVVDGTFYVLGGRNRGQRNVTATVFALDLSNLRKGWQTRPSKLPTPRGGLAAGAVGKLIYTFGGEGNPAEGSQGIFNEVEVYNTKTDSWKKLQPMAVPRHGTAAVGIGKRVYIPGGGTAQGGSPVSVMDAFVPFP
ncbi:Kelch-like protein terF [Paramyrothecium foliicola]|nr:Kelch-like protein terF [Paramyrothecium foliicola]